MPYKSNVLSSTDRTWFSRAGRQLVVASRALCFCIFVTHSHVFHPSPPCLYWLGVSSQCAFLVVWRTSFAPAVVSDGTGDGWRRPLSEGSFRCRARSTGDDDMDSGPSQPMPWCSPRESSSQRTMRSSPTNRKYEPDFLQATKDMDHSVEQTMLEQARALPSSTSSRALQVTQTPAVRAGI